MDFENIIIFKTVAPHRGVWIETSCKSLSITVKASVAPHRGVWIETNYLKLYINKTTSRPIGACGLKPWRPHWWEYRWIVAPHRGVWIETLGWVQSQYPDIGRAP